MEQDAVPARPAVNRIPGARDPATRATKRPVREELAERLSARFQPEARKRGLDRPKTPQWSAERRTSPIARGSGALASVPGWSTQPPRGPNARAPRLSALCYPLHIPGASRRGNENGCPRRNRRAGTLVPAMVRRGRRETAGTSVPALRRSRACPRDDCCNRYATAGVPNRKSQSRVKPSRTQYPARPSTASSCRAARRSRGST
jgi:hypothetical protein